LEWFDFQALIQKIPPFFSNAFSNPCMKSLPNFSSSLFFFSLVSNAPCKCFFQSIPFRKKTSPNNLASGIVTYAEPFGAKGDGKPMNMAASQAAHEIANQHRWTWRADDGALFYIGGHAITAIIQTDTDFWNCILYHSTITEVETNLHPFSWSAQVREIFKIEGSLPLKETRRKSKSHAWPSLNHGHQFQQWSSSIRFGLNQNNGAFRKLNTFL